MKIAVPVLAVLFTASSLVAQVEVTSTAVGIGTASPTSRLSISDANPYEPPLLINRAYDGARIHFTYGSGVTPAEIGMTYYGSGSIALWLGANLDSTGSSHASAPVQAISSSPSWLSVYSSGSDAYEINRIPAGGSSSTLLKIIGSGYVGIGTSPSHKLHVDGTVVAGSFTALGSWTNTSAGYALVPGGGWSWFAGNQDNDAAVLYVQSLSSTGTRELIYFGTSSDYVGSITTNGTTIAYNTSSDVRLKTNIRDLAGSGAILDALKPRIFDWRSGEKDSVGFVAQELNEVAPYAVTAGDDDPETISYRWSVDASKLVPVLTAEIKALRTRAAAQEKATNDLAQENADLRKRLDALERR